MVYLFTNKVQGCIVLILQQVKQNHLLSTQMAISTGAVQDGITLQEHHSPMQVFHLLVRERYLNIVVKFFLYQKKMVTGEIFPALRVLLTVILHGRLMGKRLPGFLMPVVSIN